MLQKCVSAGCCVVKRSIHNNAFLLIAINGWHARNKRVAAATDRCWDAVFDGSRRYRPDSLLSASASYSLFYRRSFHQEVTVISMYSGLQRFFASVAQFIAENKHQNSVLIASYLLCDGKACCQNFVSRPVILLAIAGYTGHLKYTAIRCASNKLLQLQNGEILSFLLLDACSRHAYQQQIFKQMK